MNVIQSSPHILFTNNVSRVMLLVIAGLLPGMAAHWYYFGPGILFNSIIAIITALSCEALMLRMRERPLWPFLTDGSAVVTAILLAVGLPALFPWWLTVIATAFAIIIAKHLYGGLGNNPFNPAMIGYILLLIAFPREMTMWLSPQAGGGIIDGLSTLHYTLHGQLPATFQLDAISAATPLDVVRIERASGQSVDVIMSSHVHLTHAMFGKGWDMINLLYLAGGLFLLFKRVISWRIPASMLLTVGILASLGYITNSATHATPLFHLLGGATMVGAFFIATDPVTASTTPRGQLVYGCGIGIFTYVIREFGGYPDGVAFGVLLMNLAAPLIDHYTTPRAFGHSKSESS